MENTGGGSWDLLELGRWTSSSTSFPGHQQVVPGGHGGAHQSQYQPHHSLLQQQQQQMQRQGHHHHHHHHHLTCLKLGKRQYCGEPQQQKQPQQASAKRERPSAIGGVNVIPRCQVEGCNKPLLDAKDYHRRHKVCELHSKAPVVVVLGAEQRFCQQCSRFHAVSEFDDTKRSCRRRLAGHNERRRKSSNGAGGQFIMRNHNHHHHSSLENSLIGSHFPFLPPTSPGRALSLLSSKVTPWISTPELSSRSSAALRELIAENRASLFARQLF